MSDLKAILDATKKIETLLEKQFGGSGRGLHDKLNNSTRYIPDHLVKRVRSIASVRNKAVNEQGFDLRGTGEFVKTCEETFTELVNLPPMPEGGALPAARRAPPGHPTTSAERATHYLTVGLWTAALVLVACLVYLLSTYAGRSRMSFEGAQSLADAGYSAQISTPTQSDQDLQQEDAEAPRHAAKPRKQPAPTPEAAPPPPSGPVALSDISVRYGQNIFQAHEAQIAMTVHNQTGKTLSSVQLHARLYLDGDTSPAFNEESRGALVADLGSTGLAHGQSRSVTVRAGNQASAVWVGPQALNAAHRRVEVAVRGYTDSASHQVLHHGDYVSSPDDSADATPADTASGVHDDEAPEESPVPKAAQEPMPEANADPENGTVQLSVARLSYGQSTAGKPEARVTVVVHNHTRAPLHTIKLAAQVYINGEPRPVLDTRTGDGRWGSGLSTSLGSQGLKAGASRTITLTAGRLDGPAWTAPELLNAASRRIELQVLGAAAGGHAPADVYTP